MPRVHTHYDNLKVARDAPIEVIRAAYRALCVKYHPDSHPGSERAVRVMRIINASYEVLSDSARRLEHDRWIRKVETDPVESAPFAAPEPPSREAPTQAPISTTSPAKQWLGKYSLNFIVAFFLICVGWGTYASLSPWNVARTDQPTRYVAPPEFLSDKPPQESPPAIPTKPPTLYAEPKARELIATPRYRTFEARPRPIQPLLLRPRYVRPVLAPNGSPWPLTSDYIAGYEQLNTDGLSRVTVDNGQNSSDALVKLCDRNFKRCLAIRVFFLRAHEHFAVTNIRVGGYDIRYQDLDSGVKSKSEPFDLEEIPESGGTRYSVMTLTLYKVLNGNTHFTFIGEDEF